MERTAGMRRMILTAGLLGLAGCGAVGAGIGVGPGGPRAGVAVFGGPGTALRVNSDGRAEASVVRGPVRVSTGVRR